MSGHGAQSVEVPVEVWMGDDPELALVQADMHVWSEAHPCECEALCVCETPRPRITGQP